MATYVLTISVAVTSSSVANPSVITTPTSHGFETGDSVVIAGHSGSTPSIDGTHTITRISNTTFSIPVNVTVSGTGGTATGERRWKDGSLQVTLVANGTSTFRCDLMSPLARFRPAEGQRVVLTENGTRIFGGTIQTARERGRGDLGIAPIWTEVQAVSFAELANRRYVTASIPAGTVKAALQVLDDYLTPYGVTLDGAQVNGPNIDALELDAVQLSAVLNQIADMSGYVWEIDHDLTLRMYSPGTTAAPYSVTTANGNALGDVQVERSRKNYTNRLLLRIGPSGTFEKSDSFTGDGTTDTFQLTHPITGPIPPTEAADSAVGYAVVDFPPSDTESLGEINSAAGMLWEYDADEWTVTRRSGAVPNGTAITVRYQTQFPITITVEDTADQAVNGIYERVITRTDITDGAVGLAVAEEMLAVALAQPESVRYSTLATGVIKPGMTQTVTVADRNVNATFIVSEVSMRDRGASELVRSVRAVEGVVFDGTWRDVYNRWLGGGGGATAAPASTTIVSGAVGPGTPFLSVQFNRTGLFGGNAAFTVTSDEENVLIGTGHTVNNGSYNLLIGENHVVGST